MALGKYGLPLPYVIAGKMRGPHRRTLKDGIGHDHAQPRRLKYSRRVPPTGPAVNTSNAKLLRAPLQGLTCAAALIYIGTAQAGSPASFNVAATVLPRVTLSAASQPASLVISGDDVRRGYVDATEPTRLVVVSNDPRGFAIDIWPASGIFMSVRVHGTGESVIVGRDGGTIVQRSLAGRGLPLTLTWRFMLADATVPGRYPWPLQYGVRALNPGQ